MITEVQLGQLDGGRHGLTFRSARIMPRLLLLGAKPVYKRQSAAGTKKIMIIRRLVQCYQRCRVVFRSRT